MQVQISDNNRIISLILILLVMTIVSGLSATLVLYQTAIDSTRKNLSDVAHLQLSMIETLHRLKGNQDQKQFLLQDQEIINLFVDVIEHYKQKHEGVEIDVATRRDGETVFIFPKIQSNAIQSSQSVPMYHALSGQTGTQIGLDSYGNKVLAAYEYSEKLSIGVVAKVEIEKIKQPFVRAGIYVLILSVFLVIIGVYLFFQTGSPIIKKMRDNEKRFRGLFNELTYFVAILSPDGKVEMLNDTAREHFNLESGECLGKPLHQLSLWAHSVHEQDKLQKSIAKLSPGSIIRYETTCRLPDSGIVDIDFSLKALTDSDNQIVNIIAAGNDISELLDSQKNLQESQQRYQSLVESSEATPWEMDLQLKQYIYVGCQALKLLDYPVQQWYEANFWSRHLHPDDSEEVLEFFQKAIKKSGHYDHRYRMISRQGEVVWIHNYVNVIYRDEKASSLSGYMFNITEHMEYERQLQRSQKMEALGQLTGGIAHDYNNMLGIIMGYSNILMTKLSSQPALLKYAQRINEAGHRNAKLTQKLLTFSREKTLEPETLNLNEVLDEMLHLLEKTLTARIKLVMDLSDELWDVKLDKGDFIDALLNMSINAMHAMDNGGQLTIATENVELDQVQANTLQIKPGEYVSLLLKDTGSGIDEYIQSKMFDPFFSTKGKNGTGLGLSQVYSFVKQLGGAIKVSSEIGKGSQFFIYFPRHIAEEAQDITEQELPRYLKGEEAILLVDDEPVLSEMTGEHLKLKGYKVFSAKSADQALSILNKQSIDLMLSDVIMPGMDGYQLAVRVKEIYPDVKIQLLTGYSDGKYLDQNNKLLDPDLHKNIMYKPFEINDLLTRIRSLLDEPETVSRAEIAGGSRAEKANDKLQWNENLSVHIPDIDEQHKYMFELFNYFEESIHQKDDAMIESNFSKLLNYISYHFQREEELMSACKYQGLNKHHQVHVMFKKQIHEHFDDFKAGRLNGQELLSLYRNWLVDHVSGMDQAIGLFCKDKQNEINKGLEKSNLALLSREEEND